MNTLGQTSIATSLKEVKAKFEHWRSTRVKRGRIPDELWQQVLLLTNKHSVHELSKALRLNGVEIKSRIQLNTHNIFTAQGKTDTHQSGFVEVNIPPSIEDNGSHFKTGKIELKRPDGAAIFIEHLDKKTVVQILTQFMEGLKC